MITKRIIPCLDVKDGRGVKGVNFSNLNDVSSPVELGKYYSDSGADSCFFSPLFISETLPDFSMDNLYELLQERKKDLPEGSYTTYLFQKGIDKILKKVERKLSTLIKLIY